MKNGGGVNHCVILRVEFLSSLTKPPRLKEKKSILGNPLLRFSGIYLFRENIG